MSKPHPQFASSALTTILQHCCKYPTQCVAGALIGVQGAPAAKTGDPNTVVRGMVPIVYALPLFHSSPLTPVVELALMQIQALLGDAEVKDAPHLSVPQAYKRTGNERLVVAGMYYVTSRADGLAFGCESWAPSWVLKIGACITRVYRDLSKKQKNSSKPSIREQKEDNSGGGGGGGDGGDSLQATGLSSLAARLTQRVSGGLSAVVVTVDIGQLSELFQSAVSGKAGSEYSGLLHTLKQDTDGWYAEDGDLEYAVLAKTAHDCVAACLDVKGAGKSAMLRFNQNVRDFSDWEGFLEDPKRSWLPADVGVE